MDEQKKAAVQPVALHPRTADLVDRFAAALKEKLAAAQKKYGYSDGWTQSDWMDECRVMLLHHIDKGDPRDVAAYCAFLWHHGESTIAPVAVQPAAQDEREAWQAYWNTLAVDGSESESELRAAEHSSWHAWQARAALSASTPPAAVPQGWPEKNTQLFRRANAAAKAMLAAAPQPAGKADSPVAAIPPAVSAEAWDAALLDAVDTLLDAAPCDCSHSRRYDKGEHLSGCYLFDLNIARAAMGTQPADKENGNG